MLKLTVPKKQNQLPSSRIYYVSSESNPDGPPHIVVRLSPGVTVYSREYYCDCRDFMIRHLPGRLGAASLARPVMVTLCKHAAFVRDAERSIPEGSEIVRAFKQKHVKAA